MKIILSPAKQMNNCEEKYMGFWENISIDRGDITRLHVDAIVNAANRTLLGGGGVDGAIHRAAGRELLEKCKTLHGCDTGEAKITGGYRLPAKYVIHTVGPVYAGRAEDERDLYHCYWNSLSLAREHDIHSIAFPAISTGVYGYPVLEATQIAAKAVSDWFEQNKEYSITVIFSCFDDETYRIYQEVLRETEAGHGV